MKTILLPTDFSENSKNAINYTVKLFKDIECDFYILNVQKASSFITDDLMSVSSSATIYQTIVDTAKRSIENLIRSLKIKYKNAKHKFHSVVDYDNFVDSINQLCEIKNVDLIVMGSKGASGIEKIIFGSNAMRVIQRSETSVLVIPNNYRFKHIDKIALLTDYKEQINEDELSILLDIAQLFDSKIEILHMMEEDELSKSQKEHKAILAKRFLNLKHEFIDIEGEQLHLCVQEYMVKNNVKLLAMIRRRHAFFERLFVKHNVEHLGYRLLTPFLVMEQS